MEAELARWVTENDSRLPIVAFMAGRFMDEMPGMSFGHAGTIVEGKEDTATEKIARLAEAGIVVAEEIAADPRRGPRAQGVAVRCPASSSTWRSTATSRPTGSWRPSSRRSAPWTSSPPTSGRRASWRTTSTSACSAELCIDAAPPGTVRDQQALRRRRDPPERVAPVVAVARLGPVPEARSGPPGADRGRARAGPRASSASTTPTPTSCRPHAPGEIAAALVGRYAGRRPPPREVDVVRDRRRAGPRSCTSGWPGRIAHRRGPAPRAAGTASRCASRTAGGLRCATSDAWAAPCSSPTSRAWVPTPPRSPRAEFRDRDRAQRRAPLKARLMDQSAIAGVGNLLADEILWRAPDPRRGPPGAEPKPSSTRCAA